MSVWHSAGDKAADWLVFPDVQVGWLHWFYFDVQEASSNCVYRGGLIYFGGWNSLKQELSDCVEFKKCFFQNIKGVWGGKYPKWLFRPLMYDETVKCRSALSPNSSVRFHVLFYCNILLWSIPPLNCSSSIRGWDVARNPRPKARLCGLFWGIRREIWSLQRVLGLLRFSPKMSPKGNPKLRPKSPQLTPHDENNKIFYLINLSLNNAAV